MRLVADAPQSLAFSTVSGIKSFRKYTAKNALI
jgi:hypothetical protein